MRKFTLLVASLFITIGAMAQITAVSQLSNNKCYHITSKDTQRGSFYVPSGATHITSCGGTYSNYPNRNVAVNSGSAEQQFAIILIGNRYYLYSVSAQKFTEKDGNYVKLVDAPSSYITIENSSVSGYFVIKFNGTDDGKLNFSGGYDHGAYLKNTDSNDDGNKIKITEVGDFDITATGKALKQYWTNTNPAKPWNPETVTAPSGMDTSCSDNGTKTIRMAETDVKVNISTVVVDFAFTGGNHKLHILGIDLVNENGEVVYSDYHQGKAGSPSENNAYTLSNVALGEYKLRYFVCNCANDHLLTNTAGTITVYGAVISNNEEAKAALNSLIEQVNTWIANDVIGEGVGQRSSTNENAAAEFNAIAEYYNSITEETKSSEIESKTAELQAIINSYTIIHMPIDGKAYTFKNVQKDGTTVCWFKYFAEQDSVGLTYIESEATPFICRKVADGKYTFVNNAGKYMTWRGDNAVNSNKTGVKDAYDTSTEAWTDITVAQMVAGGSVNDFGVARYVTLYGRRQPETAERDKFAYFVIEKNGGSPIYDQAAAPFYNDSYSSAFIIEEAEYANKPALNAVGESPLLTSELHNTAMATFSAPFATVVPENVTAYYATAGDGFVTLNAIAATEAIPANTGVILVGAEAGSITMRPAAGETAATIENNVLANSAGAVKTIPANSYVLSAKDGVPGFYSTDGGDLAMNKAYIAGVAALASVELRFPGTTAVEKVEMRNEKEEIYDLQGRRIDEITEPGIYIVNGVKVLVK